MDGDQFHAFIIKDNSKTVITNMIIISHNYLREKIESESESRRILRRGSNEYLFYFFFTISFI